MRKEGEREMKVRGSERKKEGERKGGGRIEGDEK